MRLRTLNLFESLFPHPVRLTLWQTLLGVCGVGLLILAIALVLALVSWSSTDASLSHATHVPVKNWLAGPGAIAADLLIQFLGLTAIAPVLLIAGWGWYLAAGYHLDRLATRVLLVVISVMFLSGYFSSFESGDGWPLVVGYGGVVGDVATYWLNIPRNIVSNALGQVTEAIIAALFALLALASLIHAVGIRLPKTSIFSSTSENLDGGSDQVNKLFNFGLFLIRAINMMIRVGYWFIRTILRFLSFLYIRVRRFTTHSKTDVADRLRLAMTRAENDELEWVSSPEDAAELNKTSRSNNSREHDLWLENPIRLITQRLHGAIRNWLHNKHDEETLDNKLSGDMHPEPRLGLDKGPLSIAEKSTPRDTTHKPKPRPRPKKSRPIVIESDSDEYQLPPLTLLNETPLVQLDKLFSKDTLIENSRALEGVLDDFGISGQIIDVRPGPVVTLYELEPAPGLKSSRVIGLADDIARSMSAVSARVAVVPGRNAIGIELPNEYRQTVFLHEIFSSKQFTSEKYKLALALGKDIGGEPIITDLARMPHLLIAGTTGSGKSVGINAMILSLLYRMKPEECRLIMIDPKMLELSVYDGIPHLLSPVVTDPSKAVVALKWAVREMESRYKKMSKLGVRSIDGFNSRAHDAIAKGEVLTRTVQTGFDRDTGKAVYETEEIAIEPMPYIVVVVDEMADLMMVAGKDIEGAIQRLAQMARAAGIHLIMATQRPSVDVITGTIKANFPTRISFQVTSKIDSRTILGEQGAEQLLGQGDMLFMAGGGRISRIHGAFITDEEVETVVQFLKRQGVPEYLDAVTAEPDAAGTASGVSDGTYDGINLSESDQLYDKAVAIVARDRKASTSYIQRRLSIGYNRAATIIERMEDEGVIGVANHSGKREVLAPEPSYDE